MNNKEQKLLVTVMVLLADTFGKKAVLRGGMVLRLIGSARYTNDLDYLFVPYKSKKEIVPKLVSCLKSIEGSKVDLSVNSQCLRILLTVGNTAIQIEAKVATASKTTAASTKLLSEEFDLPKRIISIVDHSVSMSNKLAAWNERRLLRDVYDIWFFLRMNITPDIDVLMARLKSPRYSKLVSKKDYFIGNSIGEFFDFLRAKVALLKEKDLHDELADYLSPQELAGMLPLLQAGFTRLE